MRLIVVIAIVTFAAAASAAEVYRWVDENGKVHYGDRPRPGAERMEVAPPGGSGDPADPEAAKTAAARAAECESKKKQLAGYRQAPTIKEINGLGEEREYNAEQKQKLIALTEQQVAAACGPPPEAPDAES